MNGSSTKTIPKKARHLRLLQVSDYNQFHTLAKQLDEQEKWIQSRRKNNLYVNISKISKRQRREYHSLFCVLDKDNLGTIRTEILDQVLCETGAKITNTQFRNALHIAKIKDRNNLRFQDFMKILYILENSSEQKTTLLSEHIKHWWRSETWKNLKNSTFLDKNQIGNLNNYVDKNKKNYELPIQKIPTGSILTSDFSSRRNLNHVLRRMKSVPQLQGNQENENPRQKLRPRTADKRRLRSNELKKLCCSPKNKNIKKNKRNKKLEKIKHELFQKSPTKPFNRAKQLQILNYECSAANSYRNFYIRKTKSEANLLSPIKLIQNNENILTTNNES